MCVCLCACSLEDPTVPLYTKMPSDTGSLALPLSWAKPIRPYEEAPIVECNARQVPSIRALDMMREYGQADVQALYIDPPWEHGFTVADLVRSLSFFCCFSLLCMCAMCQCSWSFPCIVW